MTCPTMTGSWFGVHIVDEETERDRLVAKQAGKASRIERHDDWYDKIKVNGGCNGCAFYNMGGDWCSVADSAEFICSDEDGEYIYKNRFKK